MRRFVEPLSRGLQTITTRACLAAGWALIVLSIVIAVNVITRKLFSYSLQGVDEYGGYCLAICASIGFSQAAYEKAHIRISVLTDLLPTRIRAWSDILALVTLTAMAIVLAIKAWDVAATSHAMQAMASSSLRTPLAIPQAMWAAALCWFSFILTVQCLRALLQVVARDWLGICRNFGVPSISDEIEEELQAANRRINNKTQEVREC